MLEDHGQQFAESNALVKWLWYWKQILFEGKINIWQNCCWKENKINTLNDKIEYDELRHHFKGENRTPICFNVFNRWLGLIRKIKDGSIDLEKGTGYQGKLKSNLSEITRGKWEHKCG